MARFGALCLIDWTGGWSQSWDVVSKAVIQPRWWKHLPIPKPLIIRPTSIWGSWKAETWSTAPTVFAVKPIIIVFFLPNLSPRVKAKIAPKNAPSCVRSQCMNARPTLLTIYRKTTRCDTGYVCFIRFWKPFLEIFGDQNARKYSLLTCVRIVERLNKSEISYLIITEPWHRRFSNCQLLERKVNIGWLTSIPALASVMKNTSQLPLRPLRKKAIVGDSDRGPWDGCDILR